jgi:hypothetical protein
VACSKIRQHVENIDRILANASPGEVKTDSHTRHVQRDAAECERKVHHIFGHVVRQRLDRRPLVLRLPHLGFGIWACMVVAPARGIKQPAGFGMPKRVYATC